MRAAIYEFLHANGPSTKDELVAHTSGHVPPQIAVRAARDRRKRSRKARGIPLEGTYSTKDDLTVGQREVINHSLYAAIQYGKVIRRTDGRFEMAEREKNGSQKHKPHGRSKAATKKEEGEEG